MTARSLSKDVVFIRPFLLKGIDRTLPAGTYRVVTDEELIEGISFPVHRRVATMIFVPGRQGGSSIEMLTIDPLDLQAALERRRPTQEILIKAVLDGFNGLPTGHSRTFRVLRPHSF